MRLNSSRQSWKKRAQLLKSSNLIMLFDLQAI
jgi:hypothetical protein